MSAAETAYKDGTCSECKGPIARGSPIRFKKGARRDGSEVSIPIHFECPAPGKAIPPPSMTPAAVPTKDHYVQIGAWVPAKAAPELLAAIARIHEREGDRDGGRA